MCEQARYALKITDAMHFQNDGYTTKSTTCNQKYDVRSRRGGFRGGIHLREGIHF